MQIRWPTRRRRTHHAPQAAWERAAVAVVAGLAAAGATWSGARPTGWILSDLVVTAGFTALVVVAASAARRWTWVWAAAAAAVGSAGILLLPATLLLVVALGLQFVGLPSRRFTGAVLAAGVVQVALRLPEGPFHGYSAMVAAVAVVPLLLSGWLLSRRVVRRRLRRGAEVVGATAGVAAIAFVVVALEVHNQTETGASLARSGLRAAHDGDAERAAYELRRAADAFDEASRLAGSWWVAPARAVPLVGPHAQALEQVSASGAKVTDRAALVAATADVGELQIVEGRVDVDLLASMVQPLSSLREALDEAGGVLDGLRSGWLASPLRARVQAIERQFDDARNDVEVAAEAAEVLPAFLGQDGPRRYFVIVGTPAETRALGGFMGNYAELTIDDGRFSLARKGLMMDLNEAGEGRQLTDPDVFPDRYLAQRPDEFWQNVTATPDLPTVAEAVRQMWPQSGGKNLDGVLYIDPHGLAALLQLTGPVALPTHDVTLEPETAAEFLLRDQYLSFSENDERKDFLLDAAEAVFDELTAGTTPGPRRFADVLSPAARSRHIMVHSFDRQANGFFERIRVDGALPPADDGDLVALTSTNVGASKLDAYVQRHIDYQVLYDPATGRVDATARVTVRNAAPPEARSRSVSGLNRGRSPGTAALQFTWYTPLSVAEARIEGDAVGVGANQEYDRWAYSVNVDVPLGEERVIEFDLQGNLPPGDVYGVTVVPQPVADPDTLTLSVDAPEGWTVDGPVDGEAGRSYPIDAERTSVFSFWRAGG